MSRLTVVVQLAGKAETLVDELYCAELKRDRHKKPAPKADTMTLTWRTEDGRTFKLQIEETSSAKPLTE